MKYKHKITGHIAIKKYDNYYKVTCMGDVIPKEWVENSNDWEIFTNVMFQTYDGFNITPGIEYYYIVESDNSNLAPWIAIKHTCDWKNPEKPPLGTKQFYLLGNANEYIIRNKPCLSLNDVKKARLKSGNTIDVLKQEIKNKIFS